MVKQRWVDDPFNRDQDSQCMRFRKTITEIKETTQNAFKTHNPSSLNEALDKNGVFAAPQREGAFAINKKDGQAYMDHKTKARKFEYDRFSKVFNPNRHSHVTAFDALVDPTITIRHEHAMPMKDPGYYELKKRDTIK